MGKVNQKSLDLESQEGAFNEAELTPNPELLTSKIPVDKADAHLGRVYYAKSDLEEDRSYFYSVTTIIDCLDKGVGFARWLGNSLSYDHAMEYANEAATVGNMVHAYLMYLVWGEEIDTSKGFYDNNTHQVLPVKNAVKKRLLGFLKFYNELKPNVLATELSLYNDRSYRSKHIYPFAGQVDLVADIGKEKWLIDYKTGKEYKHSHELQLTAYKILWDSLYGAEYGNIDKLACLYLSDGWRKGPTYKLVKYDFVPELWYKTYDLFCYLNGKNGTAAKPRFKKDFPNIYNLNEDNKKEGDSNE